MCARAPGGDDSTLQRDRDSEVCTAKAPEEHLDSAASIEDGRKLVAAVQLHECTKTCWKNNREGDKTCRFHYGTDWYNARETTDVMHVLTRAAGSQGKARTKMETRALLRRSNPWVNSHNRQILRAWRANMDVSFVR
jgi:hypothetical protein